MKLPTSHASNSKLNTSAVQVNIDSSGAVTVHVKSDVALTKTPFTPTTVRQFMASLGPLFPINRATCLINGEPIQPEALLKNGDTIEIK